MTKNKIIIIVIVIAVSSLIWFGGKSSREQNDGVSPNPHNQTIR